MGKMMNKLWGDSYFDAEAKMWRNNDTDQNGNALRRAFVQFIMDPICKLFSAIMDGDK